MCRWCWRAGYVLPSISQAPQVRPPPPAIFTFSRQTGIFCQFGIGGGDDVTSPRFLLFFPFVGNTPHSRGDVANLPSLGGTNLTSRAGEDPETGQKVSPLACVANSETHIKIPFPKTAPWGPYFIMFHSQQ